jgi:hypothetical protein
MIGGPGAGSGLPGVGGCPRTEGGQSPSLGVARGQFPRMRDRAASAAVIARLVSVRPAIMASGFTNGGERRPVHLGDGGTLRLLLLWCEEIRDPPTPDGGTPIDDVAPHDSPVDGSGSVLKQSAEPVHELRPVATLDELAEAHGVVVTPSFVEACPKERPDPKRPALAGPRLRSRKARDYVRQSRAKVGRHIADKTPEGALHQPRISQMTASSGDAGGRIS